MEVKFTRHPSSYRDPSGFLFQQNGILYRQVNQSFREDFDLLHSSGLYEKLAGAKQLIPHTLLHSNLTGEEAWYETIQPEMIPFISYPYEWCFGMWKDAALTTLGVAQAALQYGMMLKDASAYNVQWHEGQMVFIDSLSFERYEENKPWIAYRQFCEHFLAPLALMHYLQLPLQSLFLAYPDGIPLRLAKKLLPLKSRFNLHTWLHIHLHGSAAEKSGSVPSSKPVRFSKQKMVHLLQSLESAIRSFSFDGGRDLWSGYYNEAWQRDNYLQTKKDIISGWLGFIPYSSALDLGSNEGVFTELVAAGNKKLICADVDHYSINRLYQKIKRDGQKNIHPLVTDLSHPSPAIGLNNEERMSFKERVKADLVLALALIHHLAIGKNIPFSGMADFFQQLGHYLVIEFIPKEDEKIRFMLQQKKDVYQDYTVENFLAVFSGRYKLLDRQVVGTSKRTLYLMESYAV
jgi:hypothetical protein